MLNGTGNKGKMLRGTGNKDNIGEQGTQENNFSIFGEQGNKPNDFRGTREHVPPGRASLSLCTLHISEGAGILVFGRTKKMMQVLSGNF